MMLKTYKMAMSILPKFLTLKWNILRTIWRIEVGDGSFFCVFHALSFDLNFYFDRRFPLNAAHHYGLIIQHPFKRILCHALFLHLKGSQNQVKSDSNVLIVCMSEINIGAENIDFW